MSPVVPRRRVNPAFLLVLGLGLAARAEAAPRAWVEPTEIDLGVIEEGKLFERYVQLKNVGDGTLILEDMKTSCGCTAAAVDGTVELGAGQSEKVRVTFNSKNMDGTIRKTVTLTTNDPENRHFEVVLHADVHRPVRFTPKYLELRDVRMKDPWEQAVKIESDVGLGVKVREAYVLGGRMRNEPSELFDVKLLGQTREGERDVQEIAVRLRTPAKAQKVSEMLMVLTNAPSPNDTLRVAIRGEINGRIRASSGFIVLRSVDPGQTTRQDVTFASEEGSFKILRADVPDSKVQAQIFPSESGKQAVVSLSYTGEEPGTNGVRTLVVETDDPEQKRIEIPVRFQTVAKRADAAQTPGAQGAAAQTPGAQKPAVKTPAAQGSSTQGAVVKPAPGKDPKTR